MIEGIINAPRELVFKVVTEPDHIKHWWTPENVELIICETDFRTGGILHFYLKTIDPNPDFFCKSKLEKRMLDKKIWGKAVYQEIIKPEKIVRTDFFSDAEGNRKYRMLSSKTITTLVEDEGKTKFVIKFQYTSPLGWLLLRTNITKKQITESGDRLVKYIGSLQQ
ncbi:SRPBCC family protein [Baia soyae]|uniref:Activator of Hsp90 ATPase-like protein n=1 Tax=Baia soyae TaxID=1544746 RepID=A0A4R2RCE4_9BACL|nr:SRPBCC domain-containing protein [Baia soyae]TCP61050.1 activator of Hsp90 ATPase-like protein [Baia soyae]